MKRTSPKISFIIAAKLFVLLSVELNAQYSVRGTVFDAQSGEHLVGATVYDTLSGRGAVCNEYGFFSLRASEKQIVLQVSFVAYGAKVLPLELNADTTLDIRLRPSTELEEVTVHASSTRQEFLSPQMSAHSISLQESTRMPMLFGETDLIKSLQYLPGISSGVEGSSGIYVRGGSPDQNLILLDGVPVYNVTHLFGIFSVFNGDAINAATIYKGGFPARYGGRLSSVLDVRMKEGNMQEFHGAASIGLLSSKLMLEGPIMKDRTSFLFSARRTFADVLSYPVQYLINKRDNYTTDSYLGYFFHDVNAKINHIINNRNRIYLSTYLGKDEFYNKDKYSALNPETGNYDDARYRNGFNWGNRTLALRWNRLWSGTAFSNLSLSYSTFKHSQFEEQQPLYGPDGEVLIPARVDEYYNRVRDLSLRLDFHLQPFRGHQVRTGLSASIYRFEPGTDIDQGHYSNSGLYTYQSGADTVPALGARLYLEDEFSIGERFRVHAGIHTSLFRVEGKNYFLPEPRLSARYLAGDRWALKASYARMSQPVHLLTTSLVGLPTDSWVPAMASLPPGRSWQVAGGLNFLPGQGLRFSLEGFYKQMANLVEYAEGAELQMKDKNWEERVLVGSGEAYGLEFLAEKEAGRFSGSLAYTLSWNMRSFPDINDGEPFPYKYDRRHDLSLMGNWQWRKHISLSAVWVLSSGINTTVLDHRYYDPLELSKPGNSGQGGVLIKNFTERNGYQMPMYHRLDVGINFEKEKPRGVRTWSFGVYNLYNRKNPYYIYSIEGYPENEWGGVYQVTMLPLLPYLRYTFRF